MAQINIEAKWRSGSILLNYPFHISKQKIIKYHIFKDFPKISPFTISIWCGQKEPINIKEYLKPFVDELNDNLLNGIRMN